MLIFRRTSMYLESEFRVAFQTISLGKVKLVATHVLGALVVFQIHIKNTLWSFEIPSKSQLL